MPPAVKHSASVVLFDVGSEPSFLKKSEQCLLNICARKWFQSSSDTTKIILLNTKGTDNALHTKYGKAPHITEVTDTIFYDPKQIEPVIKDVETGPADWLTGLAVAMDSLNKMSKTTGNKTTGIQNLQLLFISDFQSTAKLKEKTIEFIIEQLNTLNVYLYILGPEVKVPEMLSTYNDIQEWSQKVEFLNDNGNPNLETAKKIVTKCKGIICGLKIGEELFHSYINHWGLQPWKVPLTIGSMLTINCSSVKFLRQQVAPRIKPVELEPSEPWKWHLVEDINEEVPYENVIGGIFIHDKFIPLPADVEKNFKYLGERMFKLVGFTKSKNIAEYYMHGAGTYVENDESSMFDLLLNVLVKQDKCAIARKVYMRNSKPKLVALLPDISTRKFLLVELPYKEAINNTFIKYEEHKSIKLEDAEDPAVNAAYDYLKQLDITNPSNRDHSGSVKWPLSAELINNLRLKVIGERCLKKYLDPDVEIMAEPDVSLPHFVDDVSELKEYIPAVEPEDPIEF